jgi:hypothetical protein
MDTKIMKTKTKEFVDELLLNPKLSHTEAYLRTHQTTNRKSASVGAARLLSKPSVAIYLEKHVSKARQRIVDLVDNAGKEDVQLRAAQDILDRVYGKATQRAEVQSFGISFNIDLSGNSASEELN